MTRDQKVRGTAELPRREGQQGVVMFVSENLIGVLMSDAIVYAAPECWEAVWVCG